MRHFSTEQWIDFVNQRVGNSERQAMESHLASGCERCKETLALWQRVQQAAELEGNYQPPAAAVRMAKAAFAGMAPAQESSPSIVQVLFDSFLQPALAGSRSVVIGTRQMLYRADPYQIDIQIEPKPGANRLLITGQLMNITHAGGTARDIPVTISNRRGNSVIAATNEFGEFSGEIDNSGDLELSISGHGEEPIVISLRNALDRFPGGKA